MSEGTYFIIADSHYGGGSIDICDVSSNNNLASGNDITVFPNPAHSQIFVKANSNIRNVTIRDIFGIEHFSKTFNNNSISIKENLTPGIYFATIEIDNNYLTKKIIIE